MEFLSDLIAKKVDTLAHVSGQRYLKIDANGLVIGTTNVEETDPTVPSWVKAITSGQPNQWDQAFGWGNHAGLYRPITYVPSWAEITSKPTTLAGYGITDAGLATADITAVSLSTSVLTLTRAAGNLTAAVPTWNQNTTGSAAYMSSIGNLITQHGDNRIGYSNAIASGSAGLFSSTNNSNAVITVNRHSGNFYSQLGFNPDGGVFYRAFNNVAINTTQTWQRVYLENYHPEADKWTTARTITIGSTGKSIDGSANVSWSLAEIGAAAASHTHPASQITTGTFGAGTYTMDTLLLGGQITASSAKIQVNGFQRTGGLIIHGHTTPTSISTPVDVAVQGQLMNIGSNLHWAGSRIYQDNYHPDADKWTTARTLTIGSTGKAVDGSANISWSLTEIGAAAASHTHPASQITTGTFGTGDYVFPGLVTANGGITSSTTFGENLNGVSRLFKPGGASRRFASFGNVGAIAIMLPEAAYKNNTMMRLRVEVYDYSSDESFTIWLSGYNYNAPPSGTSSWINTSVQIVSSKTDRDYTVRFGNSGTREIIWIGELNSPWDYLAVTVMDLNPAGSNMSTGWDIALETTAFGTVTSTKSNNLVSSDWNKLKNIPASFTPSAHTHTTSNITDLASYTGLDVRYFTESEADARFVLKAGDTMTGNLSFGSTTRQMLNLWSTSYGIGVQSSTAYFRTGGGFAWFRGGVHIDTQNNPGAGGTLAMSLDSSSNLSVVGTMTASSIIRSGGTSAQFLKADGSIDSTAYVPTSRTITINGTAFDLSANRAWTVGSVTSVATGTGLTGGTITSTGTLSFDTTWGDARYLRSLSILSNANAWSHTTLTAAIQLQGHTTGSTGFPSALGQYVVFQTANSDSTSNYGRMFALHRSYNTETYSISSPTTSGTANPWRTLWHSGNFNPANYQLAGSYAAASHTHSWATDITGKPTTLAGYGITDAQAFITAGTSAQYWRGDKTWQTLNTAVVAELTNLYFTESRVRSTLLTGYTIGANSALSNGDSFLSAFGKVQGQLNEKQNTISGTKTEGNVATIVSGTETWAESQIKWNLIEW